MYFDNWNHAQAVTRFANFRNLPRFTYHFKSGNPRGSAEQKRSEKKEMKLWNDQLRYHKHVNRTKLPKWILSKLPLDRKVKWLLEYLERFEEYQL